MNDKSKILVADAGVGYELIDSGEGEKLERFGDHVLSRPDPQALWKKSLGQAVWKKAEGRFEKSEKASWALSPKLPEKWEANIAGLKFWIRPSSFKHVGVFPEQTPNWAWLRQSIQSAKAKQGDIEILNLFGYTGGATLTCAAAGAKVVHVDGSKAAIAWARENAELSGLSAKPVRWILDDARVFVKREIKRGRKYDGIIMDPPAFGHGPDNQLWKIDEDFLSLFSDCLSILKEKPLFVLINGYSAGYSAMAYENNLLPLVKKHGGSVEKGELALRENDGRLLPAGIFARWKV